MTREALRLDEAAVALGVHQETLRRWLNAGQIPGRKVQGSWLGLLWSIGAMAGVAAVGYRMVCGC